jgi:hypothetical protein
MAAIIAAGLLCLLGYWQAWRRGFVIASADGAQRTRYLIREIPSRPNPFPVIFGFDPVYIYRMEVWRYPHCMTHCTTTFSYDSFFRARKPGVDYTPGSVTFYLNDEIRLSYTREGEWIREQPAHFR